MRKVVVVVVGESVRRTTLPFLYIGGGRWIEGLVPIGHLKACFAPFGGISFAARIYLAGACRGFAPEGFIAYRPGRFFPPPHATAGRA